MIRLALVAAALTLSLGATALAQDDLDQPLDETAIEQAQDQDGEAPPQPAPLPPGGDPCQYELPGGGDADYVYCAAGGSGPVPRRRPIADAAPEAAPRPLAAGQLPVTGGEPLVLALAGIGLLLAGAGLRRLTPSL